MVQRRIAGEQAWLTYLTVLLRAKEKTHLRIPATLISGWHCTTPTILYMDDTGYLRKNKDAAAGSISSFLALCQKDHFFPICIARQNTTIVVTDIKAAMALWHKSLASRKPIFLQRYISQPGQYSSLLQIKWKPESLTYVTLTNLVPYSGFVKRRSILMLGKQPSSVEDQFLTRSNQSISSCDLLNKSEIETFVDSVVTLYRRIVPEQLASLIAEFVIDRDGKWYLLRVPEYTVSHSLQNLPTLVNFRVKRSPWLKLDSKDYKHLSIKRISRTILSIKQSLGLTITTGDRERLASYTDFAKKLKQQRSLPQIKPKKVKEERKTITLQEQISQENPEIPPLFEFPTPHEEELNRSMPDLQDIKNFIKQQNNSMYMRIHYQEELSEDRKQRESAQQSVSSVAQEFDRLREQGQAGRAILRTYEDRLYTSFL